MVNPAHIQMNFGQQPQQQVQGQQQQQERYVWEMRTRSRRPSLRVRRNWGYYIGNTGTQ